MAWRILCGHDNPASELLSSLSPESSRIPFSFPIPFPVRRFWGIPLAELWSKPVSLQEILRFPESRTNLRSRENPSRSWMICKMVSLHPRRNPFLASWHHFFFLPMIVLDTGLCPTETLEVLEGLNHAGWKSHAILNLKLWEETPTPPGGSSLGIFGRGCAPWNPSLYSPAKTKPI